ncbi:MAG: hypothetical protein ACRCU2_27285 [Planktothrix sp.]
MSILIPCLNCGKSVSSENYSCIHCKAKRCRICNQKFDKPSGKLVDVCRECSPAIESAKLPQDFSFSYQVKCSLCGHDNKLSSNDRSSPFERQKPYISQSILSPKSSVRRDYNERHYRAVPEEKYLNIEYGFLSKRASGNKLFGTSGLGLKGKHNNERKHPNQNIKNFLGDSIHPVHFHCSSCGHRQSSELVFPVKFKEFKCAFCGEYGKLESMDALVYHYQKDLCTKHDTPFDYQDTLCESYEEIQLAHRSCLKYRKHLLNSAQSYSYSINKPNVSREIWSIEQVLTQANFIEEITKNRVKISDFIGSKELLFSSILAIILIIIVGGWIGVLISCLIVAVYLLLISSFNLV